MGYKYEIARWTKNASDEYHYKILLETNSFWAFLTLAWKKRNDSNAIRIVIR